MAPNVNRVGYRAAQLVRSSARMKALTTQSSLALKGRSLNHTFRRWQSQGYQTSNTVLGTVRKSSNQSLRYLGLAGALGLGGMIAYGLSRPATYVPADTRAMMSNMGGETFARMVRGRIMKTFGYLSGSIAITGATAFLLFTRGM